MDYNEMEKSSVGFLYKTMLERDPHKRRVKPVQPHLLQLDFAGLDDSSDDSDFKVPNEEESDSSIDDADDDDEGSASGTPSEHSSSADSKSETSSDEGNKKSGVPSAATKQSIAKVDTTAIGSPVNKKIQVQICCVCLRDASEAGDEVVQCDNCAVFVHEGCYGISETMSVASTESSGSTQPWFCDSCKAGINPSCELCPNSGGIYKETDNGRWVHVVCALYVPGVAFGDTDRLSNVTLFEMSYAKWGAKECCLCEDERFARTGVCIACDAGMCRTYFHVTCAQRDGLLVEASPDEDIADPFYAYCKQHADKHTMHTRRRNWLAIQSSVRNRAGHHSTTDVEQRRIQRKLTRHRQKYIAAQIGKEPSWLPTVKMPRMLLTSAYALRQLLKKSELLGIGSQVDTTLSANDIRKKWNIAPAFSVEYISYYLDRNVRITTMRQLTSELRTQHQSLQRQECQIRNKYEQLTSELSHLQTSHKELSGSVHEVWTQLSSMAGRRIKLPAILRDVRLMRTPDKSGAVKSPTVLINHCGICKKSQDQHLLVKCDKCRLHFHLGCLNPPLTRMPKKTKQLGWQCSTCAAGSDSESDSAVLDEPRRLRKKTLIREPAKYTGHTDTQSTAGRRTLIAPYNRRRALVALARIRSPKLNKPPAKKYKTAPPEQPQNVEPQPECAVCSEIVNNNSVVKCDTCQSVYHLHCLSPKSRSLRGQSNEWQCLNCKLPLKSSPSSVSDVDDVLVLDADDVDMGSQIPTATLPRNMTSQIRPKPPPSRVMRGSNVPQKSKPRPPRKRQLPAAQTCSPTSAVSRSTALSPGRRVEETSNTQRVSPAEKLASNVAVGQLVAKRSRPRVKCVAGRRVRPAMQHSAVRTGVVPAPAASAVHVKPGAVPRNVLLVRRRVIKAPNKLTYDLSPIARIVSPSKSPAGKSAPNSPSKSAASVSPNRPRNAVSASGSPRSAVSTSGAPRSAVSASGTPRSAVSASGTPRSAVSASGTPRSVVSASGTQRSAGVIVKYASQVQRPHIISSPRDISTLQVVGIPGKAGSYKAVTSLPSKQGPKILTSHKVAVPFVPRVVSPVRATSSASVIEISDSE